MLAYGMNGTQLPPAWYARSTIAWLRPLSDVSTRAPFSAMRRAIALPIAPAAMMHVFLTATSFPATNPLHRCLAATEI